MRRDKDHHDHHDHQAVVSASVCARAAAAAAAGHKGVSACHQAPPRPSCPASRSTSTPTTRLLLTTMHRAEPTPPRRPLPPGRPPNWPPRRPKGLVESGLVKAEPSLDPPIMDAISRHVPRLSADGILRKSSRSGLRNASPSLAAARRSSRPAQPSLSLAVSDKLRRATAGSRREADYPARGRILRRISPRQMPSRLPPAAPASGLRG